MKTALSTGALALIVGAATPAAAQVVTEPNSSQPSTQTAPPVTTDTSVQPPANSSTMPSTTMPSATTGPSSTYNSTTGQSTTTGPGSAYNSTTGQPTTNPSTTQTYPSTTAPSSTTPSTTTGQPTTDTTTAPPSTYPSTTTTTDQSTTTTTTDTTTGTMDPTTTGQTTTDRSTTTSTMDGTTSADGTPAFGIEPYFGILGGYHLFDRPSPIDGVRQRRLDGALIEGVIGVNIPVGPIFVGVEGHGARGFGDLRWEYGVRGRAGFRAGDSGLVYASAGYTWTNVLNRRGFPDREGWMWGIGAEFGPSDVGLGGVTGEAGPRFRISVETADFNSIRPMAGVIFHF